MISLRYKGNGEVHFKGVRYPRSQAWPSFPSLVVQKSGRGPGIFYHVNDIRIEKMVERVLIVHECAGPRNSKIR